ncbi:MULTISPECIES: glycosyltransferase family 4 protein [Nostocales]|uniref:Glycosyltransferase family 4 protein n=3 Tax=Nostocales TaxID=1161 RepID=A0A0C1RC28_9CYAN|nr:glycosyltransferase family 4 protein [Tolypothrix bouteillei]KAF3884587.1 glycosyltransferase family 4 protein [Tolypothrix bouteillei VB521301]
MKILNLIQCLNLGGMEKSAYILVNETQNRGMKWEIQSVTPAGSGKQIFVDLNIPVNDNSYEGTFGYKSHLSLKRKVQCFSGDIILVTGPTLTGCLSIKGNKHKKILGIHFCHKYNNPNLLRWKIFYKYFGDEYDAIICHSPYLLEQTAQIAPFLKHKLHLIENSTQLQPLVTKDKKLLIRQTLGIPDRAFVIGNAGWLIERKRFDVFLQVCAKVCQSYPNVFFLIAGDGPLRQELEELARNLGISDKVKFLGWQDKIDTFYQAVDLLLFNSNSDAFGRTVMEAMGYGIPVVASVLEGGTNSVLVHKENGYLIQEHNINELAEYCLHLIQNHEVYQNFQLTSLELIRNRFSNELYVQKYLEVFHKVLKN